MNIADAFSKVGFFLVYHFDLIEDIVTALANGVPKEAIKVAIRGAKVAASDAAMKSELGIDF